MMMSFSDSCLLAGRTIGGCDMTGVRGSGSVIGHWLNTAAAVTGIIIIIEAAPAASAVVVVTGEHEDEEAAAAGGGTAAAAAVGPLAAAAAATPRRSLRFLKGLFLPSKSLGGGMKESRVPRELVSSPLVSAGVGFSSRELGTESSDMPEALVAGGVGGPETEVGGVGGRSSEASAFRDLLWNGERGAAW